MKTPKAKYMNDERYRRLVDTLEAFVHDAEYTPSELREAATLACIHYEMKSLPRSMSFPDPERKIESAINTMTEWRLKPNDRRWHLGHHEKESD